MDSWGQLSADFATASAVNRGDDEKGFLAKAVYWWPVETWNTVATDSACREWRKIDLLKTPRVSLYRTNTFCILICDFRAYIHMHPARVVFSHGHFSMLHK